MILWQSPHQVEVLGTAQRVRGRWEGLGKDMVLPGICEIRSSDCPNGWTSFELSCYLSVHQGTFDEAAKHCERLGGRLTIVNSKQENDVIVELCPHEWCWIGLESREASPWARQSGATQSVFTWWQCEQQFAWDAGQAAAVFRGPGNDGASGKIEFTIHSSLQCRQDGVLNWFKVGSPDACWAECRSKDSSTLTVNVWRGRCTSCTEDVFYCHCNSDCHCTQDNFGEG